MSATFLQQASSDWTWFGPAPTVVGVALLVFWGALVALRKPVRDVRLRLVGALFFVTALSILLGFVGEGGDFGRYVAEGLENTPLEGLAVFLGVLALLASAPLATEWFFIPLYGRIRRERILQEQPLRGEVGGYRIRGTFAHDLALAGGEAVASLSRSEETEAFENRGLGAAGATSEAEPGELWREPTDAEPAAEAASSSAALAGDEGAGGAEPEEEEDVPWFMRRRRRAVLVEEEESESRLAEEAGDPVSVAEGGWEDERADSPAGESAATWDGASDDAWGESSAGSVEEPTAPEAGVDDGRGGEAEDEEVENAPATLWDEESSEEEVGEVARPVPEVAGGEEEAAEAAAPTPEAEAEGEGTEAAAEESAVDLDTEPPAADRGETETKAASESPEESDQASAEEVTSASDVEGPEAPPADAGENVSARLDTPEERLFLRAAQAVVTSRRASIAFLQRTLEVGYFPAAKLLDRLEREGVIGPYTGGVDREVLLSAEEWERRLGGATGDEGAGEAG